MKKSTIKFLIKQVLLEYASVDSDQNQSSEDNIGDDSTDENIANIIANAIWPNVKEIKPGGQQSGAKLFVVITDKGTQWIGKTLKGQWKYVKIPNGRKNDAHWVDYNPEELKENEFDGKKLPKHNATVSSTDQHQAETISNAIWGDVKEVKFHSIDRSKGFHFHISMKDGEKHYLYKDRNSRWFYGVGKGLDAKWQEFKSENLKEMSTSGGAGGYSTPFAFTKNKKGSPKGIAAASKYGKVVGENENDNENGIPSSSISKDDLIHAGYTRHPRGHKVEILSHPETGEHFIYDKSDNSLTKPNWY